MNYMQRWLRRRELSSLKRKSHKLATNFTKAPFTLASFATFDKEYDKIAKKIKHLERELNIDQE